MDEIDPRRPILSFPWTVADVLVVLKDRFSREPRLNRLEVYLNKITYFCIHREVIEENSYKACILMSKLLLVIP